MNKKKDIQKIRDNWAKMKTDNFDFELIDRYFKKSNKDNCLQVISEKTMNDIDFHELFMFIDRTNSKIGQQYLFNKLLVINSHSDFSKQEQLIDYFTKQERNRIQAQWLLSKLNKYDAYYLPSLFLDEYTQKPSWFWIIPCLSIANLLILILTFFFPKFLLLLVLVFVTNLVLHYYNKSNIHIYSGSITQLLVLCRVAKEFLKSHKNEKVWLSVQKIEEQKKEMLVFSIESKSHSDLASIPWAILEYLKIFFLIEPIIVFRVLNKIDRKRSDIHELFKYIGEIDTAISLVSLRTSLNSFCIPRILHKPSGLKMEGIYHPLIVDCVSNSLSVNEKSILLTGSNMSGKTTFIRAVAINVLCAQTINTCFAQSIALSPMCLYSAIRITDDLMSAKSYYFEEVMTIKEIINESKLDYCKLFLLDEIFKGTNTVERIAAGKAVLSYINKGSNLVFVSTHDIELTELLKDSYELYYLTEVVENENVYFDYKLKQGNLKNRNAIKILELNGYPSEIIEEANEISERITIANNKV